MILNSIIHRTMTKVEKNNIIASNSSAFVALKLIVQNYLKKRWGKENQEIPLKSRIIEDLGLNERDLKYLGKYLSVVYQTNMEVPKVENETSLWQLLQMYYQKMENRNG